MSRYNHAYTIAFSLESNDKGGEDVTPSVLRQALIKRIEALGESDEWHEAVGAPYDTYKIPEPEPSRPAFYKAAFWEAREGIPVTWYFDGLVELGKAIEAAHKHGVVRSEVQLVSDYPEGDCISDASEVLAWFKDN